MAIQTQAASTPTDTPVGAPAGSLLKRHIWTFVLLAISGSILLVLLWYYLSSKSGSTVIANLNLLPWDSAGPLWRRVLFGVTIASLAVLIVTIGRVVSWLDSRWRNVVLIGCVILGVVIISLLIGLFQPSSRLLLTRMILTLVFTGLPASMYALFITTRRQTLRQEFHYYRAKLDPVTYVASTPIYDQKFDALYGPEQPAAGSYLLGEKALPVLLSTAIIGLGWMSYWFFTSVTPQTALDYFRGDISPFTFGFLGAYLFSMQMLFRRYLQADLRSTAYTHVNQRILTTWVWSFVLFATPWPALLKIEANTNDSISILAFIIGVFPEVAWQAISQFTQRILGIFVPSFQRGLTLDKVEGITLWAETRLLEEDIENVEDLVTTGIIDLMLHTNYKPERIVDWIDQGILLLHMGNNATHPLRAAFAQRGIVTATDLLDAYAAYQQAAAPSSNGVRRCFVSESADPLVDAFVAAIADDPNMYHILAWRGEFRQLVKRLPQAVTGQLDPPSSGPALALPVASLSPAVFEVRPDEVQG